jgi:hypothetical protein
MSKKTIKILLVIVLASGGIFLISRFVGETLPGATVTQTEFDLSGVVPEGLVGYWTFDGRDMNWASTTAEALDRSGQGNHGNTIFDAGSAWYDSDYPYRQKITITAGGGSGGAATTTTNGFFILATTTQTVLKSAANGGKVQSDVGTDIVFVDNDNSTVLDYHLEKYASTTGAVTAWVEVLDISSTTAKDFYVYYGKSSASDLSDEAGTYQSYDIGVWNMVEGPTGTTTDSTSNGFDGLFVGGVTATTSAPIGDALDFDGTSSTVNIAAHTPTDNQYVMSISLWAYVTSYSFSDWFVNKEDGTGGGDWTYGLPTDAGNIQFTTDWSSGDPTAQWNSMITQNKWDNYVFTWDGTNAASTGMKLYKNGVLQAQSSNTDAGTSKTNTGAKLALGNGIRGSLDEVRISNIVLHPMDILTHYNNEVNVGTFLTFATEEEAPAAEGYVVPGKIGQGLKFDGESDYISVGDVGSGIKTITFWMKADVTASKKIINIDGTDQIETNSSSEIVATDFPAATVYVDGSSSSATVDTNWHHVAITDSTGVSASTFEIGRVGSSYFDGQIDEVRVYNRAITAAEVAELYNATKKVTIQPSPNETLRSGLVGHWTFDGPDMDWASTTAEVRGRSVNKYNGNVNGFGSEGARIGKIGQALHFDGSDDYVGFGNISALNPGTSDFTVATWIRMQSGASTNRSVGAKQDSGGAFDGWNLWIDADTKAGGIELNAKGDTGSAGKVTGPTDLRDGLWHHVAIAKIGNDRTNWKIWEDGKSVSITEGNSDTAGSVTATAEFRIGDRVLGSKFDGDIDDFRFYNRALTDAEVAELAGATKRSVIEPAQTHLVPDGLDLYLSFNGSDMNWASTTAEALDRSGNNRHSDVTNFGSGGATIGKVGQALNFDGSNDHVEVPSFSMSTNASIAAWLKLDAQTEGYEMYFEYKRWQSSTYYLSATQSCCGDARNWNINGVESNMNPELGKWYHVVMTVNGTTQKIYVDGVLDKEATITARTSATDSPRIGSNQSDGEFWNGQIDEVRVYNRTLTAAEVLELYQGR